MDTTSVPSLPDYTEFLEVFFTISIQNLRRFQWVKKKKRKEKKLAVVIRRVFADLSMLRAHAVTCYHCRSLPRWAARRGWVDGRGGFTSVNGLTETTPPMIRVEHLTIARFPPTFTRSRNNDVTLSSNSSLTQLLTPRPPNSHLLLNAASRLPLKLLVPLNEVPVDCPI